MSQQVKIITLNSNFNASTLEEFRHSIKQILNSHITIVLVDCQNVTFMDSSGLGALVLAFKSLKEANIKMVLCSINEQVRILFELTSMDDVFEIFPSQTEFNQVLLSTT